MLGIMIIGVISTIALASYQDYAARNEVQHAVTDLGTIQVAISTYAVDNQGLPQALSELGPQISGMKDPWGNAYQYIDHTTAKKGSFRKDKIFRPINSDYDLFSMGKDGSSTSNLNAKQSRDDILRGGNGRFLGLASDLDP